MIQFGGESRSSGDQLNYRHCPVCGSDGWNTYLNPANGAWFCFAGHHHAGGRVDMGLDADHPGAHLLHMLDAEPESLEWPEVELPPFHALSRQAVRYLDKRGIGLGIAAELGLVEWAGQHRILVPYFQDGDLVFWTSRRYSVRLGQGPKYWSQGGAKPLYRPFLRGAPSRKLVIVEGVFDAIAVGNAGYDTLALGGKTLPRYHRKRLLTMAQEYGTIIVLLDEDALAQQLELRDDLQSSLRQPVEIRVVPHGEDPGSMESAEIKELLK